MKILLINVTCGTGSTGRICTDLAQALEAQGHEVKIAYGRDDVPEQFQKYAHRIGNAVGVYGHVLRARLLDEAGFGSRLQTRAFLRWVREFNPDVIHLHNLCGYYIHLGELFRYLRSCGKPIFWTLHDCWALTGHSVYCDSAGCTRWQQGCHHCPMQHQFPAAWVDGSARMWKKKKKLFTGIDRMQLIAPSQWLADQLRQSFLGEYPVQVIHNGIHTAWFRPQEDDLRHFLGAEGKHLVLCFGKKQAENSPLIGKAALHVVYGEDFHGRELETLCRQAEAVVDLTGEGKPFRSLFGENTPVYDGTAALSDVAAAISCLPIPQEGAQHGYWSRKKATGLLGKEVILGVAAVWNDQKGLSDFVKLAEMLTEHQQLVMIGLNKNQLERLPAGIRGMERTANVQELAMYYGIADYFLNLTYQDTYPTTNLEAISCGTPVITYETGGSPESARLYGTAVPKGDVAAIARLLQEAPAFIRVQQSVDKTVALEEYLKLYRS